MEIKEEKYKQLVECKYPFSVYIFSPKTASRMQVSALIVSILPNSVTEVSKCVWINLRFLLVDEEEDETSQQETVAKYDERTNGIPVEILGGSQHLEKD